MIWLLTIPAAIVLAVIILAIVYAAALNKKTNPDRPEKIETANGYVTACGENLYDGEGKLMRFRGVNFGNWFVPEPWMAVMGVGEFETGHYTFRRGTAAMKANPLLTDDRIEELYHLYMQNYIGDEDFETVKRLGLDTVRIPFTYMNLLNADGSWREDAFRYLDFAVNSCEKYGLYAILDLHGAVGSQNMDNHSGDDNHFELYGNRANMDKTVEIWRKVAERYRDNKTVAAYDLINETRRKPHRFTGRKQFDFYDELYRAIREIDPFHMILMECFTFPTHGVKETVYGWENVCYEYHIYNLTPFSQKTCLGFYKALHNLKGYKVPVYIGEWNAYMNNADWQTTVEYFDKLGWSYTSWTFKTNGYLYNRGIYKNRNSWGLYELDIPPVDLSSASFEEIAAVYKSIGTQNAAKTHVYEFYSGLNERRLANGAETKK